MNVPVGTKAIDGKKVSGDSLKADLMEFLEGRNQGYICITFQGKEGFEEGLMVIEGNSVVASHYSYMALGKEYNAGEALERCLNAFHAPNGVYDVFILTAQQIELLKIFNEGILLLEGKTFAELEAMLPTSFSDSYLNTAMGAAFPEKSREEILKEKSLTEIKVDQHDIVQKQIEKPIEAPAASAKVAKKLEDYISGGGGIVESSNVKEYEISTGIVERSKEKKGEEE